MKKIIILVVSSALLIALLFGFIDVVQIKPTASKEEFTYSISSVPKNLKAIGNLDKRIQDIVCATSRGLVELDKTGSIVPALAESVEVKDNGLEYDFKISSDIYWSDGRKITSKDVVTFFREILTEENEESIGALLNVYGAKQYRNGVGTFSKDVGIRYEDDKVIFRLNSKDDKFVEELTTPQYRLRNNVLLWENINNNYDDVVYSGAYGISSISTTEILLKRNDTSDKSLVKSIHMIEESGEELAMAAFEVGNRDIVINPPKSQLTRLKKENRLLTLESDKAMYLAFNPNSESIPLAGKKEIYKLINNALEEYQLQNDIFIELAEGSYFREDKQNLLKLQSRKVMSNEVQEWKHIKELVLIAEENTQNKEMCEYLKKWFSNNTDIDISYTLMNKDEMNNLHEESYYNIALLRGESKVVGEDSLYNSLINFLPKEYKKELGSIKTEGERKEKFISIEDKLFNTYQVLPLLFYNNNIAINKNIKNIILDGNGNIDFKKLQK
ncbi:hypothetical protein JCM1393_16200 [Clostridium carnis]